METSFFLFILTTISSCLFLFLFIREQRQKQALLQERSALMTKLELEKESSSQQKLALEQMKDQLLHHFRSLSSDALKESSQSFLTLAKESFAQLNQQSKHDLERKQQDISNTLKPIQETLQRFDHKLSDLEKTRIEAFSSISTHISMISESNEKLKQETNNLVKALRAPQVRGRWGEMQLRRVVEMAGMMEHCDFIEQVSTNTEESRLRPDLLVKLPGDKTVVIDAKAVINAYIEASQADLDQDKKFKLQEHARHIKQRVSELSKKSYWEQFPHSPEFVVLFLPGEALFSAALEVDPTLIDQSVDQRVIIATPTTLIALLKSVAYGWKQSALAENARSISVLGKELHKRIGDMASHFSTLGQRLNSAVDCYNKTVGTFESRVLVTTRRFQELQVIDQEDALAKLEPIDRVTREMRIGAETTSFDGME